ncbi:hypothetical protein BO94DRAFT_568752 [Aspergillus sclerotioniger CBS 115572]|uniref:Uncharacterized protein n=1 Tax=Aspergillus sclerotioniger CBS 115572 TaxID=1450535 RepID=A0A317VRS5_9EURO|nr:hypothetical protein BO94DRAFT_568752 [Aspergillus sclerotioniger CBS 115572]PWY74600.1 hypothetical protein BO94DRAFT_568752 [Aspergillus sclerotioniger CBS 115572]
MQRRGSFCTSELPCFVESLDCFFSVSRTGDNLMGPNIRRTRSSDPVLPSLPQVDGSGEKRKVKKAKSKKKSNKSKKNKGKGKSVGGDGEVVGVAAAAQEEVVVKVKVQVEGDCGEGVEKGQSCSPPSYASFAGDQIVDEKTKTASEIAHAASLRERILAALSVSRGDERAGPSGAKERRDTDASATKVQSGGSGIDNDRTANAAEGSASPEQRAAADKNPTAGNPNPDPFASLADDSSEGTAGLAENDAETPGNTDQAVVDGDVVAAEGSTAGGKKNMDDKFIGVETLSSHFIQLYERRDLCDFHFLVKSSNGMFHPVIIPVHVAVVARSPLISALLPTPLYRQGHREVIAVLGDQVNLIHGFEHAVRSLYGMPLLQGKRLRTAALAVLGYAEETQGSYPFPINIAMVDLAFSYAASGAFLQVNSILEAGVRMALTLVDWDTVEPIFHFGLCVDDFSITLEDSVTPPDSGAGNPRHVVTRSRELREIWAPLLVRAALGFIVDNIDSQFVLYPRAVSMCIPNRIPEYLTAVPGIARSTPNRLPRRETVTISSVLLNLPYKHLKDVFKILTERRVLSNDLAQTIIVEREARRLKGLRALVKKSELIDSEIPREIKELGYQELLVSRSVHSETEGPESVTMEISLEREWTGLEVSEATASHTLSPK